MELPENVIISPDKEKDPALMDALIVSELRYRRLFESTKDGILILDATTGKITDVNPHLIELLNFPKEEFLGRELWEVGLFRDIAANKEKFEELMQQEYVRYDELPLEAKDGRIIHVEFVSNVYQEGKTKVIQCNIRDITKRYDIQTKVKFQADLLNNVGQAVIATDLPGDIIYWNQAAENIYGWSSAEAMGHNILKLTPAQQTQDQAKELMEELSKGKSWSGEFWVQRKDGSSFPAYVTDTPIFDDNGKLAGIIGISSDITEQKMFEKELIAAKAKAEESDLLKSAFLANMSHEIRTPMNGILGFIGLLKEPHLTEEEQMEYVDIIEKSGARMLEIINNIVNISKIESGLMEIYISATNINEQIEYIYNLFKPEANRKKIKISFKKSLAANEATIKTDIEKVYAILINLVNNAIKFTTYGFVEFGYEKKGDYLEFFVEDTGKGIPFAQKELIFERFRQGSQSLNRNYEGSGLGLSICKSYVEMLGGRIWVANGAENILKEGYKEKGGSRFYFTLPYVPVFKEKITDIIDIEDSRSSYKMRDLKILVAEDDAISQRLITTVTRSIVKEVILVGTGTKAVEACAKNPDIDLVLMDIKMPEMDGYEATRQIRKFNKAVHIIAQTAYGIEGDRAKAIEAGCDDYIVKPINPVVLREMIKAIFVK
jgi:PAS domain S-box-containing protein